ncbi:unnamed protein product, partial [Brassica rapa subsp. trilocularis]
YRGVEPVRLFLYFGSGSDIFSSDSVLRRCCLCAKKNVFRRKGSSSFIDSATHFTLEFNKHVQPNKGLTRQGNGNSEELRCVIVVIRHGDRTPKQKVKLNVTEEKLLNLMLKYNGGKPRAETKLKSTVQLQDLLDATRMLVPRTRVIVIQKTLNMLKLRQVKAVIEEVL